MKTWVTEVSHLPPVDAPGIPAAAARRAAFVRRIVEAATSRRVKEPWRSAVRCIARPGRKLCGARLHVARVEGGRVEWSCAACGERGLISGFEGTDLDLSAHAPRRKLPQTWLLDDEGLDVLQDATYLPELRAVLARAHPLDDDPDLLMLDATVDELDQMYTLVEHLSCETRSRRRIDLLEGLRAGLSSAIDGF